MNQSNIVNQSVKQLKKQQIKQPTDQKKKNQSIIACHIYEI